MVQIIKVLLACVVADVDKRKEEEDEDAIPKKTQQAVAIHDIGPSLERLWAYQCGLTKGRNVSSIAWNRSNPVSTSFGPSICYICGLTDGQKTDIGICHMKSLEICV